MKNEFATKEIAERLTTANVTCNIVQSLHDDSFENLVLTHKDYDFRCIVSSDAFSTYYNNTSGIFIDHLEKDEILSSNGLDFKQGYTIRDNVQCTRKWGANKDVEEPRKVNMRTAKGTRLEKFYSEWFEFLKLTEWEPYKAEAEKMSGRINGSREFVDKVLKMTSNTNSVQHDRETVLRNDFGSMTLRDTSDTSNIEVYTYSMTEEQKLKLFKFIDEMAGEAK